MIISYHRNDITKKLSIILFWGYHNSPSCYQKAEEANYAID